MNKFFNKKLFLISLLFFLGFVVKAEAATNVYYSVGQNTTDHKTGSPTLTISGGVGTFSVPQTATNLGVGDKVTFNTSSVCYISGKVSTSEWNLIQVTGAACADVTDATVDSIAHAFSSLNAAVGDASPGAAGASYLNTSNLNTGDFVLNVPVYYDSGADTVAVSINGWTTDPDNFIRIYTATSTNTEVNQNQRHSGIWSTNKYRLTATDVVASIRVIEDYVRIDGLQVQTISPTTNGRSSIQIDGGSGGSSDIRLSNNIVRGHDDATYWQYLLYPTAATSTIWNNIIYSTGNNISNVGLRVSNAGTAGNVYNNTIHMANGFGLRTVSATTVSKNNLIKMDVGSAFNNVSGTMTNTNNASSDATADDFGGSGNRVNQTFTFTDSADYHLSVLDAGAKDYGISDPGSGLFSTDIDFQTRSGSWDIGADEYTASDTTSPVVTEFTIPSTSNTYNISITTFTATDAVGVTGYLINESSATPLAGDVGWSASALSSYTTSSNGSKILYAWAKDAAGNISSSATGQVAVNSGGGTPKYYLIISSPILTISPREATLSWRTQDSTTYTMNWGERDLYNNSNQYISSEKQKEFSYVFSNLKTSTPYSYTIDIKSDTDKTQFRGEFNTPNEIFSSSASSGQANTASIALATQSPNDSINSQQSSGQASSTKFFFINPIKHLETSPNVKLLQIFLNKYLDTKISDTGPGSPGQETDFYGAKTLKAVKKFQEKYANEILYPNNLISGTGYVGLSTIKKINQLLLGN